MFILQCHKIQNNRQLLQKRDRNNVCSSRFEGRPLTDPHYTVVILTVRFTLNQVPKNTNYMNKANVYCDTS